MLIRPSSAHDASSCGCVGWKRIYSDSVKLGTQRVSGTMKGCGARDEGAGWAWEALHVASVARTPWSRRRYARPGTG